MVSRCSELVTDNPAPSAPTPRLITLWRFKRRDHPDSCIIPNGNTFHHPGKSSTCSLGGSDVVFTRDMVVGYIRGFEPLMLEVAIGPMNASS